MSEALEIPGRGSRMSALGSLLQFGKFFNKQAFSWPEEQAAKHGAPIFYAHLILPTVVVTDPVAAAHVFETPTEVCDRLGNFGFGPLLLRPEIVGRHEPALVAKDATNTQARRFINAALKDALPRFDDAVSSAITKIGADWASQGTVPFSTFNGVGSKIMAHWLLDTDVDAEEATHWPKLATYLKTRSGLLNFLLSFTGPKKSKIEAADRLFEKFRTAPRADHLRGIAKETGMGDEEALRQIAFMILFNTAGLSTLMARSLAQLALTPKWATAIRDEVGDHELTMHSVRGMPVLRKVFIEASRLFSGPRLFYRVANQAFDLPCGNGNTYRVEQGDTVLVLKRSIQRNEMFTRPHVFDPDRYEDQPDLLNYIFTFGPHEIPYRCAASDLGFGAAFYQILLGRLLQGWDWELSQSPEISPDFGDCYSPSELALVRFRARG